ncbi:MAG: hypothetical protein ACRD5L_10090, partial [Bryobacteraceae bacterium]
VNPAGLAFFAAQSATELRMAAQGIGMLRVTCFLSSLDQVQATRAEVTADFPAAAVDFVQLTRLAVQPLAACEAVGRLDKPPTQPIELIDGVALTSSPKLVFTGLQIVFSDQDSDIRLAFERLGKALESQGASFHDVIFSSTYSLDRLVARKAAALRLDVMDGGRTPGTAQVFEGLPSLDATMAIEVTAAK